MRPGAQLTARHARRSAFPGKHMRQLPGCRARSREVRANQAPRGVRAQGCRRGGCASLD